MTNWQTKKLGELASKIGSGITPRGGSDVFIDEGVLFIRSQNIKNNKVDTTDKKYIPNSVDDKMRSSRVLSGDILYNITGASIGRSAVYKLSEPANVNQHVCIVRLKDDNPKFVQYALSSAVGARNLWGFQAGGNREGLNFQQLGSFKINIPEKPEQERIVGVLEVWDEYIEKLEQKIALKEELKKGLMQQLLTGKRRLPGFSNGWKKAQLKDIASVRKGVQLNKDTLSETRVGLSVHPVVNGGVLPSGYTDVSNTRSGAITVSEGGNSCGYVNYIREDFWLGGHCYEITGGQKVDQIYLYPLLKANQSRIMSLRVGSGLPNIQKGSLESISLLFPQNKAEQESIGLIMLHSVTEIEQLENKLSELKLQKKYLLKNLITGTICTPENLKPKGANP